MVQLFMRLENIIHPKVVANVEESIGNWEHPKRSNVHIASSQLTDILTVPETLCL